MRYIIASLLAGFTFIANAQSVKVVNATSQSWSGGVAGHHGVNYAITIECGDTNIALDTAWISGNYFPITISRKDTMLRKVDRKHNTVTCKIFEWEAYNDGEQIHLVSKEQQTVNGRKPYRNYDGAALISYRQKGKPLSILIKKFSVLPALNYP